MLKRLIYFPNYEFNYEWVYLNEESDEFIPTDGLICGWKHMLKNKS